MENYLSVSVEDRSVLSVDGLFGYSQFSLILLSKISSFPQAGDRLDRAKTLNLGSSHMC